MPRIKYLVESKAAVTRRYEVMADDARHAIEIASETRTATFTEDESEEFVSAVPIKD